MTDHEYFTSLISNGVKPSDAIHAFVRDDLNITGYDIDKLNRLIRYAESEAINNYNAECDSWDFME
jgi:predicted methyltransferase